MREAKAKEIQILEDCKTFKVIKDVGQEDIGSHWMITCKEKHDEQKTDFKVRLVERGYQEVEKPQLDLPTVAKESLKLLMALAANNALS